MNALPIFVGSTSYQLLSSGHPYLKLWFPCTTSAVIRALQQFIKRIDPKKRAHQYTPMTPTQHIPESTHYYCLRILTTRKQVRSLRFTTYIRGPVMHDAMCVHSALSLSALIAHTHTPWHTLTQHTHTHTHTQKHKIKTSTRTHTRIYKHTCMQSGGWAFHDIGFIWIS